MRPKGKVIDMHSIPIGKSADGAGGFGLPLEAVTQTFGILAKRGVGKTYLALKMVEGMLAVHQQVVVVDPLGVTWGLRLDAAGQRASGAELVIFGGEHGDVPLEETAGAMIAEWVVAEGHSAVLDLSLMRKAAQVRFMTDFAERLYQKNRRPLHLVLDEADAFAPQRPMPGQQRMLGAVEDLVRRGRARGLGITLVTQRAAVLNKNVLTQVEVLVALRTVGAPDRKAMDEWVQAHGTAEERATFMSSLASLPKGTAWFWSPGWLECFTRVAVGRRATYDSSSTPAVGGRAPALRELAPIDLERLSADMRATVERAKANDPKALRARVAELERQLATPPSPPPAEVREVERHILTPEQEHTLKGLHGTFDRIAQELAQLRDEALRKLVEAGSMLETIERTARGLLARRVADALERTAVPSKFRVTKPVTQPRVVGELRAGFIDPGKASAPMMRNMLTALAQHSDGLEKRVLLLHTGYSSSGQTATAFRELVRLGYTEDLGEHRLRVTAAGLTALGPYEPLPQGTALREHLLGGTRLSRMDRNILRAVCDAYPAPIGKREVLAQTGYSASGQTSSAFGRLTRFGYVERAGGHQLRAWEGLFDG